jgi:hypothetical protein
MNLKRLLALVVVSAAIGAGSALGVGQMTAEPPSAEKVAVAVERRLSTELDEIKSEAEQAKSSAEDATSAAEDAKSAAEERSGG